MLSKLTNERIIELFYEYSDEMKLKAMEFIVQYSIITDVDIDNMWLEENPKAVEILNKLRGWLYKKRIEKI